MSRFCIRLPILPCSTSETASQESIGKTSMPLVTSLGSKLVVQSAERCAKALVKATHPGDRVITLHVLTNNAGNAKETADKPSSSVGEVPRRKRRPWISDRSPYTLQTPDVVLDDDWIHEKSTNVIRNTVVRIPVKELIELGFCGRNFTSKFKWVYVFYFRDGKPRIDWKDFNATRELTRVLLLHHRSITWVGISLPTIQGYYNNIVGKEMAGGGSRAKPDEQRISSQMFPIALPVHPHGTDYVEFERHDAGGSNMH
ncbi:hypothetical protein L2E82_12220 [Cichorium intybus]|uniref:Uncharacterized protein n=1 Tax=Cichorium intybus TaxID=13427 RepID=A0ACB9GGH2_CICIN|nr:hypothetical protein L2E82_12220 [Cichorium intybus]